MTEDQRKERIIDAFLAECREKGLTPEQALEAFQHLVDEAVASQGDDTPTD